MNDKKNIKEILLISLVLFIIVIIYWPVMVGFENIPYLGYFLGKMVLFVIFPLAAFYFYYKNINHDIKIIGILKGLGVKKPGMIESIRLSLLVLPIMLFVNYMVSMSPSSPAPAWHSGIMFVESFTEEFFFRGILFLYLWKLTDIRVAYATSIIGFILLHPQYFFGPIMLVGLVQGILTCIITHKPKNIAGAWLLHGLNRIFSLSFMPLF
ncbi:MAG: CPBP family intramembrane metalloprotease [Thermoplasmata archaeon]|nr:CPBP family intramembrane metalloprotease [Thermoplasmata archaeon]